MAVDWTWRWCTNCGVIFKDLPNTQKPCHNGGPHRPDGPLYGIDIDTAGSFARCQSCSVLVRVDVPAYAPLRTDRTLSSARTVTGCHSHRTQTIPTPVTPLAASRSAPGAEPFSSSTEQLRKLLHSNRP
jgi:hypothetical protein